MERTKTDLPACRASLDTRALGVVDRPAYRIRYTLALGVRRKRRWLTTSGGRGRSPDGI